MAIANIIARGIGFNPGSVKFIPTHGFGVGAAQSTTVVPGYGYGEPAARRRRTLVTMPDGRTVEPRGERELRRLLAELQLAEDAPAPTPKGKRARRAEAERRRDVIAAHAAEIPDETIEAFERMAMEAGDAAIAWQQVAELWRRQADDEEAIMILLAVLA